jgi:hypothetical protein
VNGLANDWNLKAILRDATKRSNETERATAGVLANRMLVVNLPIVLQQRVLVKFDKR